jgi:hypothetical protein
LGPGTADAAGGYAASWTAHVRADFSVSHAFGAARGAAAAGVLPAVWNVPLRSPAFVGRDQMLADLRDQLGVEPLMVFDNAEDPTTLRSLVKQSITVARYSQPAQVGM